MSGDPESIKSGLFSIDRRVIFIVVQQTVLTFLNGAMELEQLFVLFAKQLSIQPLANPILSRWLSFKRLSPSLHVLRPQPQSRQRLLEFSQLFVLLANLRFQFLHLLLQPSDLQILYLVSVERVKELESQVCQ